METDCLEKFNLKCIPFPAVHVVCIYTHVYICITGTFTRSSKHNIRSKVPSAVLRNSE